ncbi:NUDIX domain-containing protein [Cesiribacter andamanensis]|nr:NUDIX hydrolase [Cesiribacter andamanensis]
MNIKGEEILHKGFYTFKKLLVDYKGETLEREQIDIGRVAAALVYNTQRNTYLLVKQYRFGAGQPLQEIVAGMVDNRQNDPQQTIRKEVEEETGYRVDRLEQLMDFYPSPGASTEKVYLYYAEVSQKTAEGVGLIRSMKR